MAAVLSCVAVVLTLLPVAFGPVSVVKASAAAGTDDTFATFNGSTYFRVADNNAFDITGNLTVSAWVRPDAACVAATECVIATKELSYVFAIKNGLFNWALIDSAGNWDWRGTGVAASANHWQHVAFSASRSTNTMTMYINGRQVFQRNNSTDVPPLGRDSSHDFVIGARGNLYSNANKFTGSIDEVRVYNAARSSEAQAQADMNTWGPADASNLVAYYDFNEGSGSTLNNRVTGAASGTNLSATGTPTWSSVARTAANGNRQLVAFPRSYLVAGGGYRIPDQVTSIDYLVVAGGGGGGARHGGGGGAGGYLTATNVTVSPNDVMTVSVGGGGVGASTRTLGVIPTNGANSELSRNGTLLANAVGGGYGAGNNQQTPGSGGSGGGARTNSDGAVGTPDQGNAGGRGLNGSCASYWCGGGGGGAGGVGGNAISTAAGNGGVGRSSSLLSTTNATTLGIGHVVGGSVFFAGGGGGGAHSNAARGSGGNGGGAAGSQGTAGALSYALEGTGGGGGGGGYNDNNTPSDNFGTAGGTGVILLSYVVPCQVQSFSGAGGSTLLEYLVPAGFDSCTSTFETPAGVTALDTVIVGGGGGGGGGNTSMNTAGGGGGGGQVRNLRGHAVNASTQYSIVVGRGGTGGAGAAGAGTAGGNGVASSAFGSTATAGSGGLPAPASGTQYTVAGDGGASGSGNAGGGNDWEGGGGGGGAGSPGINGEDIQSTGGHGGPGGNGVVPGWVIGWCSSMFGGGGGGGTTATAVQSRIPSGGPGGGGTGANYTTPPTAGTDHCGGGGGGGGGMTASRDGANGGSGIVFVRYNHAYSAESFTEGSDLEVTLGSATNLGLGSSVVSDYTLGETVRAIVSTTNGTINIVSASGTTLTNNSSASVTVVGSQSQVNSALASATLTASTLASTQIMLDVDMNPTDQTIGGTTYRYHTNGHFYLYKAISNATVGVATQEAVWMSLGGRQGFLATPTSAAELAVINAVRGTAIAWIGLGDDFQENTFSLKGEDAWGPVSTGSSAITGRFVSWASGQPDNHGFVEDFVVLGWSGSSSYNDHTGAYVASGAVIEFEPKSSRRIHNVTFTGAASRTATVSASSNLGLGASHIGASTFNTSETIVATLAAPSGTTLSVSTGGATITGSGTSTLTLEGTKTTVNATLNNVTVTAGTTGDKTVTVSYRAKLANNGTSSNYRYNATTGNYYLLRSAATYSSAESDAASSSFGGVPGSLVSITTSAEQTWLKDQGWTSRFWTALNDSTNEGQWTMRTRDAYQTSGFDNTVLPGAHLPWNTNEPNGGTNQNCHANQHVGDLSDDGTCSTSNAYVLEFRPYAISQSLTLGVNAAPTITTPSSGLTATAGASYSLPISVSGGVSPFTYAITSGTLPDGLTLNSATGVISGTASEAPLSRSITVRATDANGATATTSSFTLTTDATTCTTTSTVVGGQTVHQFTDTGYCQWQVPTGVTTIDGFVVGGGGGGAGDGGGGGGGGGYHPVNGVAVTPGDVLTIRVGAGGTGGVWGGNGTSGQSSSIVSGSTILAQANGGTLGVSGPGTAGGAGGTSVGGFNGGTGGSSSAFYPSVGGNGNRGASNYFLGTAQTYGGGGGGGSYAAGQNYVAPTGSDGGGNGCDPGTSSNTPGSNGAANTGGGGGAGCAGWVTVGGAGGSGVVMIRYTTDPLDAFPADISGLQARFVADDYQTLDSTRKGWIDTANNGQSVAHTAIDGTPAISAVTGNGSSKTVRTVSGGTTDRLNFPSTVISSNTYTLFHLARYSGAAKQRIFTSNSGNWLSGFWGEKTGVAHHNNWMTTAQSSNASTSAWVLSSDQNTLYRANGRDFTTNTSSLSFTGPLSLNRGYSNKEFSDWQVPEVIVYNRVLSAAEIRRVEAYITRTYGLLGYDSADAEQGVLSARSVSATKTGNASTGVSSQLSVSWTAPFDIEGISDYKVEYRETNTSAWSTWAHTASSSLTSATLTGLESATTYDIRVTPVDSGATNRPSVTTTATTWGDTSITLSSVPNSPRTINTYTLTATVTGATGTSGTVAFFENGNAITGCATAAITTGSASCSWTPTTLGARTLTATFSGDTSYLQSSTVSASSVTVTRGECVTSTGTTGRFTFWRVLDVSDCVLPALPTGVESIDVFVVGGGGGGGENAGTGGGGGGAYYAANVAAASTDEIVVVVGAGGRGGGDNSVAFATASALRDGGAGTASSISWGSFNFTGAGGSGGQTYWSDDRCNGANRNTSAVLGGVGSGSGGTSESGGNGGLGGNPASSGGAGYSNLITGLSVAYGGGGGGGGISVAGGAGGSGGGGSGTNNGVTGISGTANTGGGGGGGGANCAYGGTGGSGIAIVRFANVPTISTAPAAATKVSGQSHTFTVTPTATGAVSGDFTYQWKKNGVAISGATSSTYTIASLSTTDAGSYSVVVKSSSGGTAVSSVESSAVSLTVNKDTQTITFSTPSARTYGDGQFAMIATASSGLLVSFASNDTTVCSVATGTVSSGITTVMVTVGKVGSCDITASQSGNSEYEPATDVTRTLVVNKKTLTLSGLAAANREYDRTTAATVSFDDYSFGSSVVGSDDVRLNFGSATASFATKTVDIAKTVTVTGLTLTGTESTNYQLPSPVETYATITAKEVTVNGAVAANKEYDGLRSASVSGTLTLNGVISGDTVTVSGSSATGTFDTKAVGTTKSVAVAGITIAGIDAGNYAVTQPTTTADITAKELTVTGLSGVNKVYDRTRTASFTGTPALSGVIGDDVVTVSAASATAEFDSRTVATSKTVSLTGVTISGADAGNYTVAQPTVTANITTAPLTMTGVSAVNRAFNGTRNATLSDSGAALVGVISPDDVTLVKSGAAATFADADVGTAKPVTVTGYALSGDDSSNYSLTQPSGLTANITPAGAGLTWSEPTAITYGTLLSATQLAAEAQVAGTFVYTPDTGALLTAGTHTLSVTFTPTSSNYATETTTVTLTVNKKTLTVTASSPTVTYGAGRPSITPSYSGFITGEGTGALTEAPSCTTLYDSTTPVSSSGIATSCSGGVAANYSFSFVNGAVTITKRTVTVTASSPTRAYGDAVGTITPSYSNDFVNGDTSSVVSNMSCSTVYTVTSAAGTTHATSCTSGTADNYQFTYVAGSITVDKKSVQVTASSPSVTYGDATPTVTPLYGAFANGDTSSVVSNMACTTAYVPTTPVASTGIATSCSGGTADNYTFTYTSGAVTISRKLLTMTASWHTVTYGDATPNVTPSYSGFVNNETESDLTATPSCSTAYTNTTPFADSGIATTCSGASGANYSFAYVDGAITINRKGVVVTASSHIVTYGDAVPTVTPSYSGFVNSETSSVVTTAPTCSTTYETTSSVDVSPSRTTSCTGAVSANYSFTYAAGAVTINKKSLTVTASSPSVPFGSPVNTVTVDPLFTGFVNSETDSVIDTAPSCTTAYTVTSPVASAPYTRCSGGSDNNYSFAFVDGAVVVTQATVTITADNKTAVYGTALGQSVTVVGLANSDAVLSVVYTYVGTGQTTYASSTTRPVNVGSYSITPSAVTLSAGSASNYTFHYTAGEASITKKSVAVTASSPTVTYGDPVPAVTATYSNDFEYADTSSVVTGTTCATTYVVTSNVGSSPGTSCSGATADNYSFTYVPGAVTVTKKLITVTASSHTVTYGDSAPNVMPSYVGFVNGQTSAAFATLATCSTTYVATSGVGSVPTSCAGAVASNYSFEYTAGAITINHKELTVTAPSPSVTYGDAVPTLTPTVTGFVNGESTTALTVQPTCSTTYTSASNAGTTPAVTCTGATAANYSFAYVAGAFTIARAEQSTVTVSATDATLVWQPGPGYATTTLVGDGGDGDGAFTYAVTSTPSVCSVSGSTLTALTAGVCKVTATKATSVNYNQKVSSEYSYTIDKATQTITFDALTTKTYGDASFSVSATASSGLTVAFAGTTGVCSVGASTISAGVSSVTVSIVAAGSCVITASQAGTINYLAATATGGSALSRSFTIAPKNLTIVGATASDKVYDGSDTAAGSVAAATLDGISFSDDVSIAPTGFTARFSDENAGSNKTVTFASVTLQGTKASNYTVTQPTATATISQASAGLTWATPTAVVFGTTLGSAQLNASAGVDGTVAYTPAPGTRLDAGDHVLSVTFTPTSSNYAVATRTVTLRVDKKQVTVTALDRSVVYGNAFVPGFSSTDLVGSDSTADVVYSYTGTGSTNYPVSTTRPLDRGSYSITPSALTLTVGDINNYDVTYVAGVLTITQAEQGTLAVVAASTGLTYSPAPSPATTTLSMPSGSTGSGTGAVSYAVVTGNTVCSVSGTTVTALTAGECTVSVTRAADLNYTTKTSAAITITIAKATQQITFETIDNQTYGVSNFAVAPTATSGLTVAVTSSDTSVCDIPTPLTVRIVSVGTCTLIAEQAGNINYLSATAAVGSNLVRSFTVSAKALTLSGVTTVSRNYDGSRDVAAQLRFGAAQFGGVVGADVVSLVSVNAAGTVATKTVGVNKPVTVGGLTLAGAHAHRYSLTAPTDVVVTITQAPLSTVGVTVAPRLYNGSDVATVDTTVGGFSGVVAGDAVTFVASGVRGRFDDALVGENKTVTVTGIVAAGDDGANYSVPDFIVTSSILHRPLTVSGITAGTREYDGFLSATSILNLSQAQLNGVVSGDSIALNTGGAVGAFTTLTAGVNKTITVTGVTISGPRSANYSLSTITVTGAISQKPLTVSGVVADNHTYDGSVDATAVVDLAQAELVGVVAPDTVNIATGAMQAQFATPTVGTNKTVTVSGLALSGIHAMNYSVVQPSTSADIVQREVTVTGVTVTSREYNGTVAATALVDTARAALANTVQGDSVSVSTVAVSASFATKTAGTNKQVTLAGFSLAGADSSNYRLRQPTATASITQRPLTVTGITAADKVDDGTTAAELSTTNAALVGVISGDAVVLDTAQAAGTFDDANVGNDKTVRVSGLAITGTDAPNYRVTQPTTTASISNATTPWMEFKAQTFVAAADSTPQTVQALQLPPAPARVTTQSVSGGNSTRVTAVRAAKDAAIPVTRAIITVASTRGTVLARINVRVDPKNPTTTVTVPYARSRVKVSVQFANDLGISAGVTKGLNVTEGNTFAWGTVNGVPQVRGTEVPGSLVFARGSSTLTPSMQATLKKMAKTARSRGGLVYVTGFAQEGELRSAWMLDSLARKRAEVVAKYLSTVGVRQWITFQGHSGARNPWNTTRERRVAISTEPFAG